MKRINILIVDDRPEGILSVQAVLTNPEYNLVTASSGAEALRHLLNYDFAVILLDVQMPIMNGFETAAMIKTRESSKDTPIIFMSAINQDELYVYQGYNAGAVDYLLKPFDPYILRAKVSIFVDIFKKNLLIQEQARLIYENELKSYAQALDRVEVESLRRYQYLADAIPQIVFQLGTNGEFSYFNKVWFSYTGRSEKESHGLGWIEGIHEDDRFHLNHLFQPLDKKVLEFEGRIKNADGQYRWHLFRMEPEPDGHGESDHSWLGTATDIEERKQREDSYHFLSEAGEMLVSSLDYETSLVNIAKLAVPVLADWCSIDVMKDGKWANVAMLHSNPKKISIAKKIHSKYLLNPEAQVGAGKSFSSGASQFYPVISKELLQSMSITNEQMDLAMQLEDKSAIIVPMSIKGATYGVISLVFSDSARRYNKGHLDMAEELARRCALAFENSTLYKISQAAIEGRDEFLSIASHELNTPITSLKLHLQMTKKAMNQGTFAPDRFLKTIDASLKQVDRLINLIEVLLDVSRIQAGKLNFNFERFDLVDVTKELSERFKDVLSSNECLLTIKGPEHLWVSWDRMRIEQVLVNLLTNAIKYAPGKIDLILSNDVDQVKIEVKDYGEGIAQEKLATIFERFERASSNRSIGGLGLGLFIVKQIMDGHNGLINVESDPHDGSKFILNLPTEIPFH